MKQYKIFRILLFLLVLGTGFVQSASAQKLSLKTNALYWATASPNLSAEIGLAPHWTLEVGGGLNPFTFKDNMKWKHWLVQPEFRWWTCREFSGHFLAAHLVGGAYNFGNIDGLPDFLGNNLSELADHRFEGWFAGAGVGYGYAWMLGKHWNLEAEIAFGAAYTNFDKYYCPKCGEKIGTDNHIYVGPTKAAINLVYLF